MRPSELDLARFKRLAVRSSDVWQVAIVRMPMWVQARPEDTPVRPRSAFWFSTRTGLIWPRVIDDTAESPVDAALRGLLDFAKKYSDTLLGRPSRIETTDEALAHDLRAALDDRECTIAVVPTLPNIRDAMQAFLAYQAGDEPTIASLTDDPAITIDALRSFAEAAADFHRARPWDALSGDEDLIAIDAPTVDPMLRYLVVTGAAGEAFGLLWFKSIDSFLRFRKQASRGRRPATVKMWSLSFGTIDEMPFGDVDAWEDHALPVAAADAYPMAACMAPPEVPTRPTAAQLASFDAILRALAASTDEEFDAGRWSRTVQVNGATVDVTMSMPEVPQDPMSEVGPHPGTSERVMHHAHRAIEASGATTEAEVNAVLAKLVEDWRATGGPPVDRAALSPKEQAHELVYAARDAAGRRQTRLARQALALWPDCADAWVILGDCARGDDDALKAYEEGIAAGRRAIGDAFASIEGEAWSHLDARPYLRACVSLGQLLQEMGREDEAVRHFREALRLDARDTLGVRWRLLELYLHTQNTTDARGLVDRFRDDDSAIWRYAAALLAYQAKSDEAEVALRRAIAMNKHVPPMLLGKKAMPAQKESYKRGSVHEAANVVEWLGRHWHETDGATAWLKEQVTPGRVSGGRRHSDQSR